MLVYDKTNSTIGIRKIENMMLYLYQNENSWAHNDNFF